MIFITRNQVEYYKLLETRRANQAQERLTQLRDFNTNRVNTLNYQEAVRSHQATEAISNEANRLQSLDVRTRQLSQEESVRSNLAREQLTREANYEVQRANKAREALTAQQNVETNRANRANERIKSEQNKLSSISINEQRRANLARESIQRRQNEISQYNAETSRRGLSETIRSNLARESETHRSNLARESEAHNYNQAQIQLGFANLNEQARYHSGTLANQQAQLQATREYNQMQYALGRQNAQISKYNAYTERLKLGETQRSNTVNQSLRERELVTSTNLRQQEANIARERNLINDYYNRRSLVEQRRHNLATEKATRELNRSTQAKNYVQAVSDIVHSSAVYIPMLLT